MGRTCEPLDAAATAGETNPDLLTKKAMVHVTQ